MALNFEFIIGRPSELRLEILMKELGQRRLCSRSEVYWADNWATTVSTCQCWSLGTTKGTLNLKKMVGFGNKSQSPNPPSPPSFGTSCEEILHSIGNCWIFYFLGCKSSPRVGILAKPPPPLGNFSQMQPFLNWVFPKLFTSSWRQKNQ